MCRKHIYLVYTNLVMDMQEALIGLVRTLVRDSVYCPSLFSVTALVL